MVITLTAKRGQTRHSVNKATETHVDARIRRSIIDGLMQVAIIHLPCPAKKRLRVRESAPTSLGRLLSLFLDGAVSEGRRIALLCCAETSHHSLR